MIVYRVSLEPSDMFGTVFTSLALQIDKVLPRLRSGRQRPQPRPVGVVLQQAQACVKDPPAGP
jgi:hypothetical protein